MCALGESFRNCRPTARIWLSLGRMLRLMGFACGFANILAIDEAVSTARVYGIILPRQILKVLLLPNSGHEP
jgi:hypothetical protein